MTATAMLDHYGVLTEPATLTIERLLPGPVERVWAYLTESDKRRKWLAAGDMAAEPGAAFELVWRNDELTDPPGLRPDGFGEEHRMASRITAFEPMSRLSFTWNERGEVTFELEPRGSGVLLRVIHRRLPDRRTMVGVSAGWHSHLDVLAARLEGRQPMPHWDNWTSLRKDYDRRLPE